MGIEIYSSSGGRRAVSGEAQGVYQFGIEQYGGYADFSFLLNVRAAELSGVVGGDRVILTAEGGEVYRGYISELTREGFQAERLSVRGFGVAQRAQTILCDTNYPAPLDVVTIAADLLTRRASRFPASVCLELLFSAPLSGILVTYDARGKSLQQALTDLCELTIGQAGGPYRWGGGTLVSAAYGFPAGSDLIYFWRVGSGQATPLQVVSVPGHDVLSAAGDVDAGEIVNRLRLTGGELQPFRQNLLPNANFENVVEPDAEGPDSIAYGNLLTNPGFESGGVHNGWGLTGWARVGSAAAKQNGGSSGTAFPSSWQGTWSAELSDTTEEANQVVSCVPGHRYRLIYYAAPSYGNSTGNAQGIVEWYTSGSAFIRQDILLGELKYAAWDRFEKTFTAPANAATVEVRLRNFSGAVSYDAVQLIDIDLPAQSDWNLIPKGAAGLSAVNWAEGNAQEGAYCVKAIVTGADTSGSNEVTLRPASPVPITPGKQYYFFAWAKAANPHNGRFRLTYYKSDGSVTGPVRDSFFSGAGIAVWGAGFIFGTAPTDAVTCLPEIVMRSNGAWYWDAITFMDSRGVLELLGATGTYPGDGIAPYIPPGPLAMEFRAEDLVTAGEDAEVNASATVYGPRRGTETAATITTREAAQAFARAYFISRSKAQRKVSLSLIGAARRLWTGENIRLVGPDGAILSGGDDLPVVRIRGFLSAAGVLNRELELGKKRPSIDGLIRQTARIEARYRR